MEIRCSDYEIPLTFDEMLDEGIEKAKVSVIGNDTHADEKIQEIKELEEEKTRIEMIAKNRIAAIKEQLRIKTEKINNEIDFNKEQLMAYTKNLKMKETKTQRSYNLLSGKLVIRKSKIKLNHDDTKILEHLLSAKDETYIKKEPKLKWGEMKEDLEIKDNQIINKTTGEILDIEGLTVEETNETLEIK
ncbi:host-nuclease inhibitor Gam family protein [Clostridium botulinum]|uniref:host-nuclease inhibitor Gam family protein n=1 Tax=Clostridium botulinum TaxID=1491 RepID=UPI00035BA277|nr:host-nuclease inhibitor Gam family protein [Clostridium botulinum]EPS48177.1 Bacteriophage Mu Gam like protein [Clostridium botulinum CFSAN002367]KON10058.1 hypothetical protein ACP52_07910 [Clostridium botulinum]MBY6907071.1 host-nuclease inhibitor Gam family protein [Clostridium botulinum]MBY6928585.1 host-nuclease inhibitor Gam family protein [Clostridium botulinum]MBY6956180.1 host-nuclease inhibitor Gam family protein [Clostridium botulinum]